MTISDLFIGGRAWWVLPVSLLVFGASFGLMPGLILRLIVLLYPKDDARRQELFAELYAPEMTRFRRFEWVFQQFETSVREGIPARRLNRKLRRSDGNHESAALPYGIDETHEDWKELSAAARFVMLDQGCEAPAMDATLREFMHRYGYEKTEDFIARFIQDPGEPVTADELRLP